MHKQHLVFICFLFSISIIKVSLLAAGESPLTPKAYLLRYWNKEIRSDLPKSSFLIEKASPLNAVESAKFAKLASDRISLSRDFDSFCKSAKLLCFPDLYIDAGAANDDTFTTSKGTDKKAGNKFKNYGYERKKVSHKFKNYGYSKTASDDQSNVGGHSFKLTGHGPSDGTFFRESMLKEGNVMPMPDIRDYMPKRSFLPRSIVSKLPFSSSKIDEMKMIFHAVDNSSMESILSGGVRVCERAPSADETKRCVGSIEDMIDFATLVLGRSVLVKTTENVAGSEKDIMIGSVKEINGGKVSKSISCHQSLFPYQLYYCHSVSKVRVYEAQIMDPKTKAHINNGVAICHMDTSTWSPTHEAFLSLGSSPGGIEICHWIFENDMAWTIANSE